MSRFRLRMSIVWCGVLIASGAVMASAGRQTAAPANVRVIEMTARKFEFSPSQIVVKKGDHVKLVITAVDTDHGISIRAFGIKQRLKKGVPTTIEFDANKVGTFPFRCSVFCGMGHRRMKGEVVVKAD